MGFHRPVIVLPETLLQSGPSEELTAALCHEMAHIRRRDYLVNLLCEFALLPLIFHPAAWLLKRRIEETRELACDEAAAGLLLRRRTTPLWSTWRNLLRRSPRLQSTLHPGRFDANIMKERIMRLLDNRVQGQPPSRQITHGRGHTRLGAGRIGGRHVLAHGDRNRECLGHTRASD